MALTLDSLQAQITALQQQLSSLQGSEALQPTYLTVSPEGLTAATFSGTVQASGIIISSGTEGGGELSDSIQWLDSSGDVWSYIEGALLPTFPPRENYSDGVLAVGQGPSESIESLGFWMTLPMLIGGEAASGEEAEGASFINAITFGLKQIAFTGAIGQKAEIAHGLYAGGEAIAPQFAIVGMLDGTEFATVQQSATPDTDYLYVSANVDETRDVYWLAIG